MTLPARRRGLPLSFREVMDLPRHPLSFGEILGRPLVYDSRGLPIRHPFDWRSGFNVAGATTYQPQPINDGNRTRRGRMLHVLFTTPLPRQLAALRAASERDGLERYAHVLPDGRLVRSNRSGNPIWVDAAPPPAGIRIIGEVHTHPSHAPLMAPPSVQDTDAVATGWPVLLVIDQQRIWGIFPPRHTALLGRLSEAGEFERLDPTDPRADLVFEISAR